MSKRIRFKFIHIPKTGGETIDVLLKIPKNHRFAVDRIREGYWSNTFKFAIVRNPWDRMVSWYFHLRKPMYRDKLLKSLHGNEWKSGSLNSVKKGDLLHPHDHCRLAMKLPFDKWLEKILVDSRYRHRFFEDQTRWILDGHGRMIVNYVGRFENYANDLSTILRRLGRAELIPKIFKCNKSIHRDYHEYYTPKLQALVAKKYAKEIAYFGFQF